MNRSRLLILLALLAVGPCAFADIADNFMAGGIAFTGSGSFSDDLANPSSSSNQYAHLTITISPVATFYLLDFFAFSLLPSFTYASNYTDGNNYQPVLTYGLSLGFTWYPYFDPAHLFDAKSWLWNPNYPLVLAIGFAVGPFLDQYLPGKYSNGIAYEGAHELGVRFTPSLGVYYFISERYAFDIIVNPTIAIPFAITGGSNSPTAYPPLNDAQLTLSTSLGITFFVPWAERSQIRK